MASWALNERVLGPNVRKAPSASEAPTAGGDAVQEGRQELPAAAGGRYARGCRYERRLEAFAQADQVVAEHGRDAPEGECAGRGLACGAQG